MDQDIEPTLQPITLFQFLHCSSEITRAWTGRFAPASMRIDIPRLSYVRI